MKNKKELNNWIDNHLIIDVIGFDSNKKKEIKKSIKQNIINDLKVKETIIK